MSDYHHLKPAIWKKRISTCQFEKTLPNGHGRSVSRFTVISTTADTEADGYDPYRSSRMLQGCDSQISHTKITVHRDGQVVSTASATHMNRGRSSSNSRRMRGSSTRASLTSRPQSSRGSLTSIRSSRQGTPQVRVPNLRHKRGVDFSHIRKRSKSEGPGQRHGVGRARSGTVDEVAKPQRASAPFAGSPSPSLTRMPDGTYPKAIRTVETPTGGVSKAHGVSMIFNEELRHFSNNIAKDCDAAFKSCIVVDDSDCDSLTTATERRRESHPFSLTLDSPTTTLSPATEASASSWHSRPLPPLPKDASIKSHATTRMTPGLRPGSSDKDEMAGSSVQGEVNRSTILIPRQVDRRIVSAPAYSQASRKLSTLPSINENGGLHGDGIRIVSAPPHSPMRRANQKNHSMEYLSKVEQTIRVVNSPATGSAPKFSSQINDTAETGDGSLRRNLHHQMAQGPKDSDDHVYDVESEPKKKKSSWFKRVSRIESGPDSSVTEARRTSSSTDSKQVRSDEEMSEQAKKRNFSFPFWKVNKTKDPSVIMEGEQFAGLFKAVDSMLTALQEIWKFRRSNRSALNRLFENGNLECHR